VRAGIQRSEQYNELAEFPKCFVKLGSGVDDKGKADSERALAINWSFQ